MMRTRAIKQAAWLLIFLLTQGTGSYSSSAADIRIPQDIKDIYIAVAKVKEGDRLLISPGTYSLDHSIVLSKSIRIKGEKGPDKTILQGDGTFPVIIVEQNASPTIEGLTICSRPLAKEDIPPVRGGGIYVAKNAAPIIRNNIIRENQAVFGGGIYCDTGSSPVIEMSHILLNKAGASGGGIFLFQTKAMVSRNTLQANVAHRAGGGVFAYKDTAEIKNCIIWKNSAQTGGGIHLEESSCQVLNCTIVSPC